MTVVADRVGSSAVRPGHAFDETALATWMAGHVEGFHGPLTVRKFDGGQSNPTYRLTTPDADYVLRKKPSGPVLPGAHAIEREARVLSVLERTAVPVPRVFGLCDDPRVIGAPFYVMELVAGRIFWDATLADLPPEQRAACFEAMNGTLAALHRIDIESLGLRDFGRSDDYVGRQIRRWTRAYQEDAQAGRDEAMEALIDWLPAHRPASDEVALVHGDFRIDNIIFHPHQPRVVAVLDWELSTLGHPLVDFANHAMMYHMPPDITAGLAGADVAGLGLPSEADYVAEYCRRTGRDMIADYDFYLVLNLFRLASIFHGIKGRVIRGTAASAEAMTRAEQFPRLARLALDRARSFRSG